MGAHVFSCFQLSQKPVGDLVEDRPDAPAESVNLDEAPVRAYYWVLASVWSGGLIQEFVGSLGGWGGLVTNRSGCAA